jgi:hypothetical protein
MVWMPNGHEYEITIEGDAQNDSFASKQPCPHCGRLYRTRSAMIIHIDTKHEGRNADGGI